MSDVLTIAEIEARYRDEWILIGDPELDEALQVLSGKVLYHGKDRDEMYRKAQESKVRRIATLYTGEIPEDEEMIL
ncbi:MAG TPA: hypothetical protein VJ739_07790 [Gemmataceae bacterium]|nr:hypothetical protein [Gemmataceae bacterium]